MMKFLLVATCLASATVAGVPAVVADTPENLWSHLDRVEDLVDLRNLTADWSQAAGGRLQLAATPDARGGYAWATVPPPAGGWNLSRRASIEAEVRNRGSAAVDVQLWTVADRGWESVGDAATIESGATRRLTCHLRETFADGTPKLDPARIGRVRVVLRNAKPETAIEVSQLVAAGKSPPWSRPDGRLEVPPIEQGPPAAGRRVRHRMAGDKKPGVECLLYLPEDWSPGGRYPVIVEYPGNIFFVAGCYSTGLPEQCLIGYGMSQGRGAIWLSMPFIAGPSGTVVENGWGDPDATADSCIAAVNEVCTTFGGDPHNVVLTGFSRGAIACGFIGLRNDSIARLWKAFHLCQHYDGDGWNGATLAGALDRARRFRGVSVFHTDNPAEKLQPLTDAMGVPTTFVQSGLGAHSTAMFLDDRESTRRLRRWFADLVADR